MPAPLEGIRVIDWTVFQQGPVAGVMLADLGAEVIKIEDRITGDPARGMMQLLGVMVGDVKGRNAYFEFNNRGKKSLTVDLRKEKGREIIHKLAEKSDVFLHNHRPDYPKRLGIDYEALSKNNPKLIYANASGWGPKGPEAMEGSMDYTGQAKSGFMFAGVEDGNHPMVNGGGGPGDQMGSIMTAYGIMTALFTRERTGIGQEIHASLLGGLLWLQAMALSMTCLWGKNLPNPPRSKANNPMWNHYKCKDENWVALSHLAPDMLWPNLCKALGMENLEKDPRFESMVVRGANSPELIKIMDEIFMTKPRDEWVKILRQNKLICSPVNKLLDIVNDPQALANEYVTEFEHPDWGKVKWPGLPIQFTKTPGNPKTWAPQFGQNTEEVLVDILGYSWEDITKLQDEEVI